MRKLWLDFETRSFIDLKDCGMFRYTKDATTQVLMLAWAIDEGEVHLWLPILGEAMPEELRAALLDADTQKMAWNYNFERRVLKYKLGIDIPQAQWFDPSVLCGYMSLPIGLDRAANALNLDIELKKTHLIGKTNPKKIFSIPTKATKTMLKKNPGQAEFYFKDWNSHPAEWQAFCDYCVQDVVAERAVWHAAVNMNCPMPACEIQTWLLDQRMNERGVYIDLDYVNNALKYAVDESDKLIAEMKSVSGLENPNSTQQLSGWLAGQNYPFKSTDKAHIDEALKEAKRFKLSPLALEMLELRKKLGGSAYKKLQSILDRVSDDQRLRDQFLYHGAHTGRWSGRGVQLQNLFKAIQSVTTVLDPVTSSIRAGKLDIAAIVAAYNATEKGQKEPLKQFTMMDAVAGTIRSAFMATPGMKLVMCDLAQIESRVLAALAGCQSMIDAYASGADLYCDFMTWLLKKTVTKKDKAERARGKIVILGCGFGMGIDKFIEYAATFGVTMTEKDAKEAVYGFREKYPEIPALWKALDSACLKAVRLNICVYVNGMVVDGRNPEMLKIKLPNGRHLHYLRPVITQEETDWGAIREGVSYESWDEKGLNMKRLYGGLITENVVQAVARDLLVNGMIEAEKAGFVIIMTIHDELVCEASLDSSLGMKDLEKAMCTVPDWGEGMGFVLGAEADENGYYKK